MTKELNINLRHLSGSTVNSFISNRPSFYRSKIIGRPFFANENMCRGKAVEYVVNKWCEGHIYVDDEQIKQWALANYDEEMQPYAQVTPSYSKFTDDIRDTIPQLAVLAVKYYQNLFGPAGAMTQTKININLPGVELDFLGYLDFFRPGTDFSDCKVLKRTPSKLDQSYCISAAIYKQATGVNGFYDVFVPLKKGPQHKRLKVTSDDFKFGLSYAIAAGKCIEQVQRIEDPKQMMATLLSFPDLNAVYDKTEKKELADEYGIILRPCDIGEDE